MTINKYTTVLIRDRTVKYNAESLREPQSVKDVLCKLFHADRLPTERFWELCFDCQLHPVGAFEVASGCATFCAADIPSIARNALLTGATGIVIAHNHPSGNAEPSRDDIAFTKSVAQGMKLLGLELLDHIIVTANSWYSFKEHELL